MNVVIIANDIRTRRKIWCFTSNHYMKIMNCYLLNFKLDPFTLIIIIIYYIHKLALPRSIFHLLCISTRCCHPASNHRHTGNRKYCHQCNEYLFHSKEVKTYLIFCNGSNGCSSVDELNTSSIWPNRSTAINISTNGRFSIPFSAQSTRYYLRLSSQNHEKGHINAKIKPKLPDFQ